MMASGSIDESDRVSPIEPGIKFRTIDRRTLDGSFYRGEGNSTLVLFLPSERKVVRFRKSDGDSGDETSEDDDGETRVRLMVNFHRNIISGLMGNYSTEPEIVRFKDSKRWMKFHEPDRPANRRHKKVIGTFATTLPDYALLPLNLDEKICDNHSTFGIEIKPKDGSIEDSKLTGETCDYCRKQFDKVREGKISRPSSYCPSDLFSGTKLGIFRALEGLVESPQNNFRIFKDGKLVWGEEFDNSELVVILAEFFDREESYDENLRSMFRLIHEALLRPFPQSNRSNNDSKFRASSHLPIDSVLERIHRVQKNYHCKVDSIYHIYSSYSKILNDEMVYSQNDNGGECWLEINNARDSEMPSVGELGALRDYLIHRISRDCSILMAFRKIDPNEIGDVPMNNLIEISQRMYFVFNNAITDLDPKNVHSIEKHHRRESKIL